MPMAHVRDVLERRGAIVRWNTQFCTFAVGFERGRAHGRTHAHAVPGGHVPGGDYVKLAIGLFLVPIATTIYMQAVGLAMGREREPAHGCAVVLEFEFSKAGHRRDLQAMFDAFRRLSPIPTASSPREGAHGDTRASALASSPGTLRKRSGARLTRFTQTLMPTGMPREIHRRKCAGLPGSAGLCADGAGSISVRHRSADAPGAYAVEPRGRCCPAA